MKKSDTGHYRKIDCPVCGHNKFRTVRRNQIWGCCECGQTLVRVKCHDGCGC